MSTNLAQLRNEEMSRVVDPDGSIRPRIDTGFRMGGKASEFLKGERVFDASEQISAVINPQIIATAFAQAQETAPAPPAQEIDDEDAAIEALAAQLAVDAPSPVPAAGPEQEVEVEDADTGQRTWVPASELETADDDPTFDESDGACVPA